MSDQPPPPPPPPPASAPAAAAPWDLGSALSWAWAKFQANTAQLVIAALALVGGMVVVVVLGVVLIGAVTSSAEYKCDDDFNCGFEGGTPFLVTSILYVAMAVVLLLVAQVISAGIIRGVLGVADGQPFQAAAVFRTDGIGPVLVTSLIVAAASFVGFLLCYLPGIAVMFATSYALYFVIDKGMAPMDAIKASVELVRANLGPTIIWYIVGGIIGQVGFMICGVGGLVSLPIMLLGTAYTYRKLSGQPVAA